MRSCSGPMRVVVNEWSKTTSFNTFAGRNEGDELVHPIQASILLRDNELESKKQTMIQLYFRLRLLQGAVIGEFKKLRRIGSKIHLPTCPVKTHQDSMRSSMYGGSDDTLLLADHTDKYFCAA